MGSIDAACIGGFLCRLCSEMNRLVIHVYSDKGIKYGLAKKINAYLPVTITPDDPLPKTICRACISRLINQHQFMVTIHKNNARFRSELRQTRSTQSTESGSNESSTSTSQQPQSNAETHENSTTLSNLEEEAVEQTDASNTLSTRRKRERPRQNN